MNKHGFTLAEVLITLGIIGVVAALTTPALIENISNAKVGPRLQKAKANFETAAELMLTQENQGSISGLIDEGSDFRTLLTRYMEANINDDDSITYKLYTKAGSITPENRLDVDDGMIYYITFYENTLQPSSDYADIPHNRGVGEVFVDVNGPDKPNILGKDLFGFELYNDGSLAPMGGRGFAKHQKQTDMSKYSWSSTEKDSEWSCSAHSVGQGYGCTGSIFDNGMKIIYE